MSEVQIQLNNYVLLNKMIYKSTTKFYLVLAIAFTVVPYIFDLICGVPLSDIKNELSEIFSFKSTSFLLLIPGLGLVFIGGICKEVVEDEISFRVKAMFGMIVREYKKEELNFSYTDKTLVIPGGTPSIVSNEHILLKSSKHKSVIYSIGTSKFEILKKKLERIIRENEPDQKPPSSDFSKVI